MIRAFRNEEGRCRVETLGPEAPELPAGTTWVDLLHPAPEEEAFLEHLLGIDIPTREEMREIEASSRLYAVDC